MISEVFRTSKVSYLGKCTLREDSVNPVRLRITEGMRKKAEYAACPQISGTHGRRCPLNPAQFPALDPKLVNPKPLHP